MAYSSPIGMFTTDINLIITSWNDWLEKITGITEESVKGVKLTNVIPDIEHRGIYDRFLKVLTEGSVELLTSVFHHYLIRIPLNVPVGKYNEMQQRVTILPLTEDEVVLGTLVTIEDVTLQFVSKDEATRYEYIEGLSSSDWKIRNDAALSLKDAGKALVSEILKKIRLEHHNPGVLSSAMKVVAMSNEDINEVLIEFLNDDDHELRIYAAQMLSDRNSPEVIDALLTALNDPDENVRYHVIETLGKLKSVSAVEPLAGIALERNFFTSFPAIDALREIGDSRSAKLLYPLIDDEFLGGPILDALGEMGESDAVPVMVNMINNKTPLILNVSASLQRINERYIQIFGDRQFIPDLVSKHIKSEGIKNLLDVLERPDLGTDEFKSLISVLTWIDDQDIRMVLTRYLDHSETCRQVIDAFVSSGHKVIDLLISQLNGPYEIKRSTVLALGRIGSSEAVDALLPLLKDDEMAVITCGALARIGDKRAFNPLIELIGHQNSSIRRAAIAALNSIGHPGMEKVIIPLFCNSNPLIRESAIRISGYFGYNACKTFVHQMLSDMNVNVRVAAIENLPFFDDDRMMAALLSLYNDENSKIREAVVKSLGQVEFRQSWLVLANALDDIDEWVRYYAVRSIDNHGYVDILEKIRNLAVNDPVPFVRLASVEYLGHIGGSLATSILSSLMNDPNHDVALAAVNALGDVHHPDALLPLITLANTSDHEMRKTAIEALGRRGGQGVAEVLQWSALTEKNPEVKNSAVSGLRMMASKDSVNALLNLTTDNSLREKAISALSGLPESMLDVIATGLDHKHPQARKAVIEILMRFHSPRASEIISGCLNHQDMNIRLSAIYALHKLGNRKHLKKILSLRESDPEPVIRKTVEDIISASASEFI